VAAPKPVAEQPAKDFEPSAEDAERAKREKRVEDAYLVNVIREVKGKGPSQEEMEAEFAKAIREARAENAVRRTEEPKVADTYKVMYTFVFKERSDFEKAAKSVAADPESETTDTLPMEDYVRTAFLSDGSVVRITKMIPGGVEVVFIAGEHKGETGFMTHMLARYAARVNRPE